MPRKVISNFNPVAMFFVAAAVVMQLVLIATLAYQHNPRSLTVTSQLDLHYASMALWWVPALLAFGGFVALLTDDVITLLVIMGLFIGSNWAAVVLSTHQHDPHLLAGGALAAAIAAYAAQYHLRFNLWPCRFRPEERSGVRA